MDHYVEGEPQEVIECSQTSQTPSLRSQVRAKRVNYKSFFEEPKKSLKRSHKRRTTVNDRKTVSQCLEQEWKHSRRVSKQPVPAGAAVAAAPPVPTKPAPSSPATELEEYVKFGTQQSALSQPPPKGWNLQPCPSVSVFAQQEHVVAKYIANEAVEARVEAELQTLLNGFRAEYERQCVTVAESPAIRPCKPMAPPPPPSPPATPDLPDTIPDTAPMELAAPDEPMRFQVSDMQMFSSEHSLMPTFSEEIARLEEIAASGGDRNMKVPTLSTLLSDVPEVRKELSPIITDKPMEPAAVATYLNLSPQLEPVDMELEEPAPDHRRAVGNRTKYASIPSQRHYAPIPADHRLRSSTAPALVPWRHPAPPATADRGVQMNGTRKKRNVGIQYRPTASFDYTDSNLVALGQAVEADPNLLYQRMRRIAGTLHEPAGYQDLATLFTHDDPYYANLAHFM